LGVECVGSGCTSAPGTIVEVYDGLHCRFGSMVQPPCWDIPAVPHVLPEGYTWLTYSPGSGNGSAFSPIASIGGDAGVRAEHFRKMDDLLADLDAGVL